MVTSYAIAYYCAAAMGFIYLLLRAYQNRAIEIAGLRLSILTLVAVVYAIGMLRAEGVDISTYRYAFESDYSIVPDLGFQAIMIFFDMLGLPFSAMLLSIGLINLLAVRRLARYYHLDFGLLFIIWFLHLVVVRDFAQFRIGFAVALIIYGLTSRVVFIRWLLYCCASAIHLSSIVLVAVYELCRRIAFLRSGRLRIVALSSLVVAVLLAGSLLPHLAFVDERIELYLQWNDSGYGAAVDSYGLLILNLFVLTSVAFTRAAQGVGPNIRTIIYMQVIGVVVFISLSSAAIFAFRLSNIILTFYPVLLLYSFSSMHVSFGKRSISTVMSLVVISTFMLVLLLRPSSFEIIEAISY